MALHIHFSGLLETELQVNMKVSFYKMVLKMLLIGDTGEDSALYGHCTGLPRDRALSHYDSLLKYGL